MAKWPRLGRSIQLAFNRWPSAQPRRCSYRYPPGAESLGFCRGTKTNDFGCFVKDVLAMQGPTVLEYSQDGTDERRPNGDDRDGVLVESAHSPTVPHLDTI